MLDLLIMHYTGYFLHFFAYFAFLRYSLFLSQSSEGLVNAVCVIQFLFFAGCFMIYFLFCLFFFRVGKLSLCTLI